MAISILFNPMPQRIFEADGDFAAGALAYFYLARTSSPLAVYTDATSSTPHPWPVVADAYGLLPPIFIQKGTEYKVRITDALDNLLYAADGIDNPAEPTGGEGGGGGLVITADQIAKPGDFDWQPTTADRAGWVRSNGLTIGPPTSSPAATGRANVDCEALFIFLWNTFPDNLCPVTPGGRGTNAAADWNAGFGTKSIATLDMRGYGNAGLDDMGTAAANRVQVTTAIGTTVGLTGASVSSSIGLCAGMYIHAPSVVAVGTKIAAILTLTDIVLSAAAIATNGSILARFSIFQNAIAPGSGGGENVHVQLASELAVHTHAFTGTSGAAYLGATPTVAVGTGLSVEGNAFLNETGASRAMNIWTPTRLGTWFCKI
jgi:hypothetical protein